jgi:hypothetical protein
MKIALLSGIEQECTLKHLTGPNMQWALFQINEGESERFAHYQSGAWKEISSLEIISKLAYWESVATGRE